MRVNVFDGETNAAVATNVELAECFDMPHMPNEYADAFAELLRTGQHEVGGGAAPVFRIVRTDMVDFDGSLVPLRDLLSQDRANIDFDTNGVMHGSYPF